MNNFSLPFLTVVIANIDNIATRRNFLLAITDTGIALSNEYVFIFAQSRSLGMLQQSEQFILVKTWCQSRLSGHKTAGVIKE